MAITSVLVAPRLTRRFGRRRVLYVMLLLLAADLAGMALVVGQLWPLIAGIVVGGLFLGVMNTVLTESVMEATDLPRSVASSTYSGIRFLGGGVAPAVAGVVAARLGASAPYVVGAVALLVSTAVLLAGSRTLRRIDHEPEPTALEEAEILAAADA